MSNLDFNVFLTPPLQKRFLRKHKELFQKKSNILIDTIFQDIENGYIQDMKCDLSTLKSAENNILLDNENLNADDNLFFILNLIKKKILDK